MAVVGLQVDTGRLPRGVPEDGLEDVHWPAPSLRAKPR